MVKRPDPLRDSYRRCRDINRRAGATFYWSAQLLSTARRPHVHALYVFARCADDIVDDVSGAGPADRAADLAAFSQRFFDDLTRGRSDDPLLRAVVDTVQRFDIPADAFHRFLRSMEMDLTISSYDTWDDLLGYMDGSAAVIGEMVLPILGPADLAAATEPARALGLAFQLTNFLRDVDEDLDRGRHYLPQEDLRRYDVDLSERGVTPGFVELMRFEIARCRELYRAAEPGIAMLPGRSARCIRAAHNLYARILDRIEGQSYDVFSSRASVTTPTKLAVVGRGLIG